jgi:hypothetical protein
MGSERCEVGRFFLRAVVMWYISCYLGIAWPSSAGLVSAVWGWAVLGVECVYHTSHELITRKHWIVWR